MSTNQSSSPYVLFVLGNNLGISRVREIHKGKRSIRSEVTLSPSTKITRWKKRSQHCGRAQVVNSSGLPYTRSGLHLSDYSSMPVRRLGRGVSRAILPMHRDPWCGYTRWSIIQTQQGIVLAMIGLTKTSLFRINLIFLRTKEEKKVVEPIFTLLPWQTSFT